MRRFAVIVLRIASIGIAVCAVAFVALGGSSSFDVKAGATANFLRTARTFATLPFIEETPLTGEDRGRVNILLLGMSGPGYESPMLTDSIVIANINTETKQTSLVSVPRDLLVQLPDNRLVSRINTLYLTKKLDDERAGITDVASHTSLVRAKLEEITGLSIPYAIVLNVAALENVVNALGGVNVFVERDIRDPQFPTTGYGHETFSLDAGWRFLDGATAQKYARTRHDIRGDFGRMERQQQVIAALLAKAKALSLIRDLPKILSLISTLGTNLGTNADAREIKRAWSIAQDINPTNIRTLALDGGQTDSLLTDYRPYLGAGVASTLVPRAGTFDYSEIRARVAELLQK